VKRNPVLKSIIVSVALSAVLAGCGSSSSSSDDTKVKSTQINGKAVDGYLKYATVCLDISKDGYCQANEPMTRTNEDGSFTLDIKPEVKNQKGFDEAMLLVYGGVDVDTGDEFKGKLLAPADRNEISVTPLTTIVAKMVQEDIKDQGDLSKDEIKQKIEDAKAKVAEALDVNVEDLTKDPVALKDTNSKLIKEALKIQKAIEAYKVDGNRDDIEKVYEQLAKHLKKADQTIEKKDAQEILKEVLKESKYLDIADNIDDAFENFDGDLQKVSHVTKEDLRKIKKDQNVKRSDSDWAKYKDYDKDKWADEFIKSDLEDIGIEDVSYEDIRKIKEKIGNGTTIKPGILKEIKVTIKNNDDESKKQIFEIIKNIKVKKAEEKKNKESDKSPVDNPSISDDTQSAPASSVGTDDNSSASNTQEDEQTSDMFSSYPGSFIYFQDNKYLKSIAFYEGTAKLKLTDGSRIDGKWSFDYNGMLIENSDEEFRLYLYPTDKDFKNGPGSFSHDDDIGLVIYYQGDIMGQGYKM